MPQTTISPFIETAQKSGQVAIVTAGTAVQGPNVTGLNGFYLTPSTANTAGSYIYVGNDGNGDVSVDTGFHLSIGQTILVQVRNLNELWFDASGNGFECCWLKA